MATDVEPGQGESGQPAGKRRTRIMVDVSPELRRRIKVAAAQCDLSVRAYVERILERAVPKAGGEGERERTGQQAGEERQPISAEWVAELMRFRDELARKHPEVVFEDSVETIRQMRGERSRHLESL